MFMDQNLNYSVKILLHFEEVYLKTIIFKIYSIYILSDVQKLSKPYLFINFPLATGDEFYIRILSIDLNYRTP